MNRLYYVNNEDLAEVSTVSCWKLCLYGFLLLFSMFFHFLLATFSVLLTTGTVFEWTLYFIFTSVLLIWAWINHIVAIRIICDTSLIQTIKTYMTISYLVQLGLHAMLALPILGFYTSYPDARGLWIAVVYVGIFNWVMHATNFCVFYFMLVPTQNAPQTYVYVPVQQHSITNY